MKVEKGGGSKELPKIDIKLKDTTPVVSSTGGKIFQEGVILRKLSRFATGNTVDSLIPISVFYDIKTGEVIKELLPKELYEEFGFEEPKEEESKA